MSALAAMFKEEIERLVSKEIKGQIADLTKELKQAQADLADVRKQVESLASNGLPAPRRNARKANNNHVPGARFSPRSVRNHRDKLGLSAADYGSLVGVSALTIYNWEKGTSRPRRQQLESLVEVRAMGKREALKRLAANGGAPAGGEA